MQIRSHVVALVTLLVLGTSAILGVSIQSPAVTPCSTPLAMSLHQELATARLCTGILEPACPAPFTIRAGTHFTVWGVTGGCFGPKP